MEKGRAHSEAFQLRGGDMSMILHGFFGEEMVKTCASQHRWTDGRNGEGEARWAIGHWWATGGVENQGQLESSSRKARHCLKNINLGWVSTTDSPKMNIHIPFSVGVYEDHPLTCCVAKCLWTGYQTTHLQSTLHCADLLFQWVHLLIGFLTHSVGPLKDQ